MFCSTIAVYSAPSVDAIVSLCCARSVFRAGVCVFISLPVFRRLVVTHKCSIIIIFVSSLRLMTVWSAEERVLSDTNLSFVLLSPRHSLLAMHEPSIILSAIIIVGLWLKFAASEAGGDVQVSLNCSNSPQYSNSTPNSFNIYLTAAEWYQRYFFAAIRVCFQPWFASVFCCISWISMQIRRRNVLITCNLTWLLSRFFMEQPQRYLWRVEWIETNRRLGRVRNCLYIYNHWSQKKLLD